MANLIESPIYESGIFQLEKSTPPLGGAPVIDNGVPSAGHANAQALQLANRTANHQIRLTQAESDIDTLQTQVGGVTGPTGTDNITYEGEPLTSQLNLTKALLSYTELRAYSGAASDIHITNPGIEGFFTIGSGADDNGTLIVDTLGRTWQRVYTGQIEISWFQPTNDGVASDATAINAALLANHKRGGGGVSGDSLVWRLGETLHIGKNTSLFLNPKARMIRGHAGDVLRNDIDVTSATSNYSGNGNIEVWGGQWEGNPAEFYNTFSFCQIGYADGVLFKFSTFLDTIRSHVFDLSAVKNVLLEDCNFLGFAGAASAGEPVAASAFTEAVQIDPNVPSSFPFGARNGTVSSEITLRRCTFGPNPDQTDSRFTSWGCGLGQHGSFHNQFMRGIRVEDCLFNGLTYSAVRGIRWIDVWVINNRFLNCKRGVHSTPIPYNSASANTTAGVPSGVGQTGRNWNMRGNVYDGCTDNAIVFAEISAFNTTEAVFFHQGVTIDDETFRNMPNNAAMALRYVSGAKVGKNRYENVLRGVDFDCSRDSHVIGGEIASVIQQFVLVKEDLLVSGKASVSRNIDISNVVGNGVGYEFARIDCPAKSVNVFGNNVSAVCNSNAALAAIAYYGGAVGGLVVGNSMRGDGTTKPSYGLYVNATATGITESSNLFEFSVSAVGNNGIAKPPVTLGPVVMDLPQIGAYGTGVLQFGHWPAGIWSPKLQLSSAGNLTPLVTGTYNLGSSTLTFAAGFFNQIRVGVAAASQVSIATGSASPEGVLTSLPGSIYMQLNGTTGKLWVKETGSGNTGWVAK